MRWREVAVSADERLGAAIDECGHREKKCFMNTASSTRTGRFMEGHKSRKNAFAAKPHEMHVCARDPVATPFASSPAPQSPSPARFAVSHIPTVHCAKHAPYAHVFCLSAGLSVWLAGSVTCRRYQTAAEVNILDGSVDTAAPDFVENASRMQALVADLEAKVAAIRDGRWLGPMTAEAGRLR